MCRRVLSPYVCRLFRDLDIHEEAEPFNPLPNSQPARRNGYWEEIAEIREVMSTVPDEIEDRVLEEPYHLVVDVGITTLSGEFAMHFDVSQTPEQWDDITQVTNRAHAVIKIMGATAKFDSHVEEDQANTTEMVLSNFEQFKAISIETTNIPDLVLSFLEYLCIIKQQREEHMQQGPTSDTVLFPQVEYPPQWIFDSGLNVSGETMVFFTFIALTAIVFFREGVPVGVQLEYAPP